MRADVADIMAALGRHDAAATLRYSIQAPDVDTLMESNVDLQIEVDHAADMLANLEDLLCDDCAARWKGVQP